MQSLKKISSFLQRNWLPILIITIAAAIQGYLISRPLQVLLTNIVPDDAFYYFQIARNIAQGHGSSFDGMNPTNGYHPLWLIVLIPIYKIWSVGGINDILPIQIALGLSVILNIATAFLVLAMISRYTSDRLIVLFGMILWCFNPFIVYETINGLETSLSLFLVSLFIFLALRLRERETRSRYIGIAIVAGLMILARIDNVFYFAAFLVWLLTRESYQVSWKKVLQTGIITAAIILPYFIWNVAHFGMILTSASASNTLVNHELITQDHGPSLAQKAKAVIYGTHYQLDKLLLQTGIYAIALVFLGIGICVWLVGNTNTGKQALVRKLEVVLFLGFVGNFLANVAIRWTARTWYFMPFNIFLVLYIVFLLNKLLPRISFKKSVAVLLVGLVAFSFYVTWRKELRARFALQDDMYAAALWLNDNVPLTTKVGVFNAGIQGYFSEIRVINLDGLVNNAASTALGQKRLWSYIVHENIEYISDFDIYLSYRYKSFFDTPDIFKSLEPVAAIDTSSENNISSRKLIVYRIVR